MVDQPQLTRMLIKSVEDTAYNFLRSLSVKVTLEKAARWSKTSLRELRSRSIQYDPKLEVKSCPGDLDFRDFSLELIKSFDSIAPSRCKPKLFDASGDKTFIDFHWSGAVKLVEFEDSTRQRAIEQLQLLSAFANMHPQSKEFVTVIGQLILQEAHYRLYSRALCMRSNEFASLVLLWVFSADVRQSIVPPLGVLVVLAVLSCVKLMDQFGEILMGFRAFGLKGIRVYFRVWTSFLVLTEVYTSIVMIAMLSCYPTHAYDFKYTWFDSNPVLIMFVVVLRYVQFLLSILVSGFFGSTILPAFQAAISKESLRFLSFLVLILFASAHGYWSLPIAGEDSFLEVLVRMFRMEYVGDFNMHELEGVSDVMNLTTGEINEGSSTEWHNGVRVMFVGCSMMTTIISLNVYIGVISNTYDELKENSQQLLQHFRSQINLRQLLRRKFWQLHYGCDPIILPLRIVQGCARCCRRWLCGNECAVSGRACRGMWIVAPRSLSEQGAVCSHQRR